MGVPVSSFTAVSLDPALASFLHRQHVVDLAGLTEPGTWA